MIHLLNRKELLVTFKLEEQARVRDILAANGIDYRVKTVNRASPSPFSSGTRGRSGTFGLRTDAMYEYIIYVKKEDCDRAIRLVRGKGM